MLLWNLHNQIIFHNSSNLRLKTKEEVHTHKNQVSKITHRHLEAIKITLIKQNINQTKTIQRIKVGIRRNNTILKESQILNK